jgi:hypothetical protein
VIVEYVVDCLSDAHKEAWIALYVAHSALTKQIDRRLEAAGVVTLDIYEVLLALEECEGYRMKMSQLAETIFLSKSGLTRLVDRLEREGLLCRKACINDRRAQYAALRAWRHARLLGLSIATPSPRSLQAKCRPMRPSVWCRFCAE